MRTPQELGVFNTLISLVRSAAVPDVAARGIITTDVIRWQKCDGLYKITDKGGFEQGQAAYWTDAEATSPPSGRAIFDMYTEMEDYFTNGKGTVSGADTEKGQYTTDSDSSLV